MGFSVVVPALASATINQFVAYINAMDRLSAVQFFFATRLIIIAF
jgi:hypothetical protein